MGQQRERNYLGFLGQDGASLACLIRSSLIILLCQRYPWVKISDCFADLLWYEEEVESSMTCKKHTAARGSGARMIVLSLVLFFSSACSSSALSGPAQGVATASPVPTTAIAGSGMLPGQQVW